MVRGKEGLLIAVKKGTFLSVEKVTDKTADGDKNVLSVRVRYPNFTLRAIVVHAPQESQKLEAQRFFEMIKLETERGQLNGDSILVLGDMNARVASIDGEVQCEGHSANGVLLYELMKKHSLNAANLHPNATGKWTRIQPKKDKVEKSQIDFILLESDLLGSILDMTVDECKAYTPYRVTRGKNKQVLTFSDHCAMIVSLNLDLGAIQPSEAKEKMWKITEAGLLKYKDLTQNRSVFFSQEESTTDMYRAWEHYLENTLSKCFKLRKACTPPQKPMHAGGQFVRTVLNKIAAKGKIQREVALTYIKELHVWETRKLEEIRTEKLKDTISNFSEDEKTPPNAYWKIIKATRGKERTKISSLVRNDGVEVFTEESIQHEIIGEFEHRLRNRPAREGWENYTNLTNALAEAIMTSSENTDIPDFSLQELNTMIKKLKRKKSPGPDGVMSEFLMEAGEGILLSLLDVLNSVKNTKQIPQQWNEVNIAIIFKNKGSRKEIINYRGIFLASVVSKVFEKLLKSRIKNELAGIDLCQAGSRSNRGPTDNTFIVNAVIDHHKYLNKCLFLTTYDFQQAFDSLWLQDCVLSLHKLGVPGSVLQIIFNLNRVARIRVKSQFGLTSAATVEDIVQQGRVLAPDLCSASTAEYCGRNKGVSVGLCVISSLAFVDDMLDMSLDCHDAEDANLNAVCFGHKKKLTYSGGKCKTMAVNAKKKDKLPSMFIEGEEMERVTSFKYLGDIFQSNGNNGGLITDRIARGTKVLTQMEVVMAESQSSCTEHCFCPVSCSTPKLGETSQEPTSASSKHPPT